MTIKQHRQILKLLEELQAETKATDKVFKIFMDAVLTLLCEEEK